MKFDTGYLDGRLDSAGKKRLTDEDSFARQNTWHYARHVHRYVRVFHDVVRSTVFPSSRIIGGGVVAGFSVRRNSKLPRADFTRIPGQFV